MLSRFVSNPGRVHWEAAKHLLAYIKGTRDLQLVFDKSISQMVGYTNSDYAGCKDSRKSTNGYCFMLAGCTITWRSTRQTAIALSSTEAEYIRDE